MRVTTGGLDYADFVGYDDDRWLSKRKLIWEQMTEIRQISIRVGSGFNLLNKKGMGRRLGHVAVQPNG